MKQVNSAARILIMRYIASIVCALILSVSMQAKASEGFDELVKLIKSGAAEDIVLAYVEASTTQYQLTVDEILYLNDIGVSAKVIAEVMKHGKDLRDVAAKNTPEAAVPPPIAPADAQPPAAPAVADVPVVQPAAADNVQDPVIGRPAPLDAPAAQGPVAQVPAAQGPVEAAPPPPMANPNAAPGTVVAREVISSEPMGPQPVTQIVDGGPGPQPGGEVIGGDPANTVVYAPPADQVNISFFYESLSPYGSWINVDGAYYWKPTVVAVDPDWRPYLNHGRWVYSDYGWAWHSEYSWGWAPFHYGRWQHHGMYGWIWMPDTTWGPAWVSWRTSDAHLGWAPLPPSARYETGVGFQFHGKHVDVGFHFGLGVDDYAFVETRHFAEPMLVVHAVPHARQTVIYNQTIVVNNYTYNDNRIINHGPDVARVERVSARPVERTRIVDAQVRPGQRLTRGEAVQGNSLAMYRPTVANTAPESPAAVQKRRNEEYQRQLATQPKTSPARTSVAPAAPDRFNRNEPQRNVPSTRPEVANQPATSRPGAQHDASPTAQQRADSAAADAQRQREAAQNAKRDQDRYERLAKNEQDQARRTELKNQAEAAKQAASDAKRRQRDLEDQADTQRKNAEAAAKAQAKEQERINKERARTPDPAPRVDPTPRREYTPPAVRTPDATPPRVDPTPRHDIRPAPTPSVDVPQPRQDGGLMRRGAVEDTGHKSIPTPAPPVTPPPAASTPAPATTSPAVTPGTSTQDPRKQPDSSSRSDRDPTRKRRGDDK